MSPSVRAQRLALRLVPAEGKSMAWCSQACGPQTAQVALLYAPSNPFRATPHPQIH